MSSIDTNTTPPPVWTWSKVVKYAPAAILGIVRAATITYGAALIRGDEHQWLLIAFGLAVACEAIRLEHKVAHRLNHPINPTQSWLGLAPTFLIVMVAATGLNALAAFEVVHGEVKQREDASTQAAYWTSETGRIRRWLDDARSGAATAQVAKQREIDDERAAIDAARAAKAPVSRTRLTALTREVAAMRAVAAELGKLQGPSLLAPTTPQAIATELTRAVDALAPVSVRVRQIAGVPPLALPLSYEPPTTDLVSMFVAESTEMTPRARAGWLIALGMELMSLCALYQGGRRTPLAVRLDDWRDRSRAARRSLFERERNTAPVDGPGAMAFRLEPCGYSGSLRHPDLHRLPASEVAILIADVLAAEPELRGATINRLTTATGRTLDNAQPVLSQLDGSPLTVILESV